MAGAPPPSNPWRQIRRQNERAMKHGIIGRLTTDEWLDVCAAHHWLCAKCLRKLPLEIDHVLPIALGGTNEIENIQPLCTECNNVKRANHIDYRETFTRRLAKQKPGFWKKIQNRTKEVQDV